MQYQNNMNYHKKGKFEAAQHYRDLDGNSKSFTYVNHDSKGTTTLYNTTEEEKEEIFKQLQADRKRLEDNILKEDGTLCPFPLQGIYTVVVGERRVWKEETIRDKGVSFDTILTIWNLVEKRKEFYAPKTY